MANDSAAGPAELRELRRGVLGPCVLALLESRPRFGLELVRDLAAADGLLTSDGTVYPLLNRLRDAGLVSSDWQAAEGQRPRRYYSITPDGRASLAAFRSEWARFSTTVTDVLGPTNQQAGSPSEPPGGHVDPGAEGSGGPPGTQNDPGAQGGPGARRAAGRPADALTPAASGGRR
ncbi:MAG: PadR family transcriptional regulator [Actinomycetota bacterium]|nr:PadR family transcriptional regulator [Actinomycetota bacterium]